MGIELAFMAVGAAVQADGANKAANAAGNAAMSKQSAAQRQYDQVSQMTEAPSIAAMLNFDQAIKSQEKHLSRQEQMISQIDPTIIEASQQALKLLRGEDAGVTAPLKRQRDNQRQKLLNSLREQLGPGAETSTAGIQALTRFDAETDSLFANAQQQAIQGLGSTAGQFNALRPNMLGEAQGLAGLGQGRYGIAADRARLLQTSGQNVIDSAGAEHVAAGIRGQGQSALGGSIMGFGASMLGGAKEFGSLRNGTELIKSSTGGSYKDYGNIA